MAPFKSKKLLVLEANIDDMNPQWYEPLMENLFEAGALDVTLIPSLMKKNRPAVVLQILTEPRLKNKLLEMMFQHSTTLGVRSYFVERFELRREIKKVKTPYGVVAVKVARDATGQVINVAPEYESCLELARKNKVSVKIVHAAVLKIGIK